jgi:hypothetical protein
MSMWAPIPSEAPVLLLLSSSSLVVLVVVEQQGTVNANENGTTQTGHSHSVSQQAVVGGGVPSTRATTTPSYLRLVFWATTWVWHRSL